MKRIRQGKISAFFRKEVASMQNDLFLQELDDEQLAMVTGGHHHHSAHHHNAPTTIDIIYITNNYYVVNSPGTQISNVSIGTSRNSPNSITPTNVIV
jgi:hypothetical protein